MVFASVAMVGVVIGGWIVVGLTGLRGRKGCDEYLRTTPTNWDHNWDQAGQAQHQSNT